MHCSSSGDQTNVEAKPAAMTMPSESQSKDLVISILDDLIANEVLAERPSQSPKHAEITAEDLQELKAKVQKKNETLRETLKASYNRLRQIQTKCFQSHVAQQLTNILDLKQKQKIAASSPSLSDISATESLAASGASVVSAAETNEATDKPLATTESVIDDTSVDLLTSILKSNLSEPVENGDVTPVDAAIKSLLDDIQYEILKQGDDNKSNYKKQKTGSDTESGTEDEADDDHLSSPQWPKPIGTTPTVPVVAQLQNGIDSAAEVKTNQPENVKTSNDDAHGKLTDSSNLFWSKTRVQLGSEWTRVQTKLKQLKSKSKHCNDYMDRRQAVLDKLDSEKITTTETEKLSENNGTNPTETTRNDQAAIAALSTSLQESVAAEVFASTTQQQQQLPEPTASRCIPYNRSANWPSSRLYNLSRSDLVELDDDVLKSFYFTLRYFGNTYFKTMCMCRNASEISISADRVGSSAATAARNRNNYYFQKKRRSLLQLQEQLNSTAAEVTNGAAADGSKEARESLLKASQVTAAELLTVQGKTCIFCHLIKKYEQARMVENITATTDSFLSLNANGKQARSVKVTSTAAKSKKKQQQLELMKLKDKAHDQPNSQFLSTVSKSNEDDGILADPNLVNRDHSYCKQPTCKKNLTSNGSSDNAADLNQDSNQQIIGTETKVDEELIDKLVGDRLSRIFDGVIVKAEKTEATVVTTTEMDHTVNGEDAKGNDEELIDAGLDLTPDDLQKLPDLSYEELKFLNEIELDKNTYRKKFDFVNDSLDLSCENNAYTRDYTSFLSHHNNSTTNSAYPLPSQLTAEIFQALSYRPKYRNLLNKKRREHRQLELSELKKVESASFKKQRERATIAKLNKLAENKEKAVDKKNTRALNVRPRKRQRSTSSYSSNSSIVSSSFNDSNCGESTGSNSSPTNHGHSRSSSTYFNYYAGSNKYDIDNIVIPFDSSCSAGLRSAELAEKLKQSNVLTPKWRVNHLEPMINITDDVQERLDNEYFEQLHAQKELKNRFDSFGKKLKLSHGQQLLSASLPANLLSSCLSDNGSNKKKTPNSPKLNEPLVEDKLCSSLNLSKQQQHWPGRKFPLSDYEYEIMIEQDQMHRPRQQQPSNCT